MSKSPSTDSQLFVRSALTWVIPPLLVALLGWVLPLVLALGQSSGALDLRTLKVLTWVAVGSVGVAAISLALMLATYHRVRRLESERRSLQAERTEAETGRQEAIANHRRQTALFSDLSQEMRVPIHKFLGMTSQALSTELEGEDRETIEGAQTQCESLLGTLNDLIKLSNLEVGHTEFKTDRFDLRALIDGIAELFSAQADQKGLSFGVIVDPRTPLAVAGDEVRVRQVLACLLDNAIHFTTDGEITLDVARRQAEESTSIHFEVRDTGIGIDHALQNRLSSLFETQNPERSGAQGIGLEISKRLVELMHGEIGFSSEPGQGSTFWFTIPVAVLEEVSTSDADDRRLLHGKRVLCVESGEATRRSAEALLDSLDITYDCVSDTAEALELIHRSRGLDNGYDLVLLDWRVMDRSGFGLALSIQSDLFVDNTKVVVTLQPGERLSDLEMSEWGVAATFTKPVTASKLKQLLATWETSTRSSAELLSPRSLPRL